MPPPVKPPGWFMILVLVLFILWYSMNKVGLVKFSHSVPVWIIGLKFIQFPGPVSSLSVIVFRHSALIQVPGLIGHSIAVHTPPGKQPQLWWQRNHKVSSYTDSLKWRFAGLVGLRFTVLYLSFSMPDTFLGWDFWISQSRIFHISVSSWIFNLLCRLNPRHTRINTSLHSHVIFVWERITETLYKL